MNKLWPVCFAVVMVLSGCAPTGARVETPNIAAGRDAVARRDYDIALGNLVPLARTGDPEAEWRLGDLYITGPANQFSQSRSDGVELLKKAAAQGYAFAQYDLGVLYQNGKQVPQNDAEAARLYRLAADQDNVAAEVALGYCYDVGRGVPIDYTEAIRWNARAAEQGNAFAMQNIAYGYREGRGLPKSGKDAAYWYSVASRLAPNEALRTQENAARDKEAGQLPVAEAQQAIGESFAWSPGKGSLDHVRRDAKLAVTGEADAGPKVSGSGVIFTHGGNVLTAAHVVDRCQSITAGLPGGAKLPAELVASDPANDIAVLKTGLAVGTPAQIRTSPPRLGEAVTAAGYPLGSILNNDLNVTAGTVSALSGLRDDSAMLQVTAAVQPGNSGGPLFDGSGNLLGIVAQKINALGIAVVTGVIPENLSYAVKASVVRLFLETKGLSYESGTGKPLSSTDLANAARNVTVKIECVRS